MNVYTGLLFLQGHVADPGLFDDDAGYRQRSYGNRVANDRVLRDRWENERREHHAPDAAADGREDDVASQPKAA